MFWDSHNNDESDRTKELWKDNERRSGLIFVRKVSRSDCSRQRHKVDRNSEELLSSELEEYYAMFQYFIRTALADV